MQRILKSRSRVTLAICLIVVIAIGLASRLVPGDFPRIISKDLGDALWGLMFLLLVLLVQPRIKTLRAAIVAMVLVSAIEFFKLYHAHWIESVRANAGGALLLGRVFLWDNFISYATGLLLGVAGDRLLPQITPPAKPPAGD